MNGCVAIVMAAIYVVALGVLLVFEYRQVERTTDGARAHAIMEATGKPRIGAVAQLVAAGLLLGGAALGGVGLVLTIYGQFVHEKAWIEAGQAVPIS